MQLVNESNPCSYLKMHGLKWKCTDGSNSGSTSVAESAADGEIRCSFSKAVLQTVAEVADEHVVLTASRFGSGILQEAV